MTNLSLMQLKVRIPECVNPFSLILTTWPCQSVYTALSKNMDDQLGTVSKFSINMQQLYYICTPPPLCLLMKSTLSQGTGLLIRKGLKLFILPVSLVKMGKQCTFVHNSNSYVSRTANQDILEDFFPFINECIFAMPKW